MRLRLVDAGTARLGTPPSGRRAASEFVLRRGTARHVAHPFRPLRSIPPAIGVSPQWIREPTFWGRRLRRRSSREGIDLATAMATDHGGGPNRLSAPRTRSGAVPLGAHDDRLTLGVCCVGPRDSADEGEHRSADDHEETPADACADQRRQRFGLFRFVIHIDRVVDGDAPGDDRYADNSDRASPLATPVCPTRGQG